MVPSWNIPSAKNLKEELFSVDASQYKRPSIMPEDIAFLQYTGGTTGMAKAAILTHRNITSNVLQITEWTKSMIRPGKEIVITALPMYHIFSLTVNCILFTTVGAKNILITNPRDMFGLIKELSKWDFTVITGVNTLFNGMLANPKFKNLSFDSLRLVIGGGMAVQKIVADKWKKTTGTTIVEAYGLTETSPGACINPMTLKDFNGKIGLPICSTEIAILDDGGQPLAIGETGEIAIRGPQVMKGYWDQPEETANVMTEDNFFKTGDIGFMDESGYVQIIDRKKDMILVSGFNVYPNEIEAVLVECPGIFEAAAIGVFDEEMGEKIKVFIVKDDDSLTEEMILAHCRESLTGYKIPRLFEFRKDLPKSNIGKILRKDLRDLEKKKT